MSPVQNERPRVLVPALITLIGFAILVSLGIWQLERRTWKETLIATLEERLAASPSLLPPPVEWDRVSPDEYAFRRVTFPAQFAPGRPVLVFTSGSGLRPDVHGAGYWALALARLAGGSQIVVNRGFVPADQRTAPGLDRPPTGLLDMVGVARWPEPPGWFTPRDDPERDQWFSRDLAAIAAARQWGKVAPFMIELEAPQAPGGLPLAGPLTVSLRNQHLVYAITWFGLALALAVVFLAWAATRRRR